LAEIVKHKSVLQAGLRKKLGIDRGRLSRLVGRLEASELIVRARAPDKRQRPIEARPGARSLLRRLDTQADEAGAKALAPLGPEKQRVLALRLGEVVTLLEGLKGGPATGDAAAER
jgi:DNA-binding MarR family transcriptional regulator